MIAPAFAGSSTDKALTMEFLAGRRRNQADWPRGVG